MLEVDRTAARRGDARRHRRLRVALLSFDFGDFCVPLANALAPRCDVLLQLPDDQVAPRAHRLRSEVELDAFTKPRLRQPVRQVAMVRRLTTTARTFGADVVHLQQGHLWFNVLGAARARPLVVTVHDPTPHVGDRASSRTPQPIMARAFHAADHLIAHTEEVRRRLIEDHGIAPASISVVPLLPPDIDDAPETLAPTRAARPPTVLFFGRIWPYKGLEHLIRATPDIAAAVPDVRIVIAGEGEDLDRYRQLMDEPHRFAVYNEHVSDALRHELFTAADVVVLPYVDATQSGVIPLAQRFGVPVVASRVGGIVEQVTDEVTGLLVAPRDQSGLAHAVVRLLTDPVLRRRIGDEGRRRLADSSAGDLVAARSVAIYESVLTARSAR